MISVQRSIAVLAAFGLAACSTDPTAADLAVTLDAAVVAGEAAAQDVEVMRGPGGPLGFGLRADPGQFNCDGAQRGGMTVTRTCVYKDAGGATQTAYDETTTASVAVHTEVSGSMDRGHVSGSMERVTDLLVTGLAGAETSMTWNGSGSGSSTRTRVNDAGETRQYDMTFSGTIADVVIPVPRTEGSWPLSGTITRNITATFTGGERDGETVQRTVTIEFNGTQYATLTVNGESFEFDLAARGRPHRGGGRHGP